jgi:phosphatidylglycerophosphate synthase
MFDAAIRRRIDPYLDRLGARIARHGATANAVTATGLGLGLGSALAIAFGAFGFALTLLILSRVADGLDGAVARATRPTDFGGYFDITADFLFYGAVPLGFALYDPAANAIPAAVLLLSFYFNGASFLGFAIQAEKQRLSTESQGRKSLYYSPGLLEGTETITFFIALCLWPGVFGTSAYGFAALCFYTGAARVFWAKGLLR